MQRVIDTQYTFVLFCRVFATRKSRPALPAPLPLLPSSHSSLFFSEVCSLFSVTAVSQPFVYQSLRHSFRRDGGSHPSSAPFATRTGLRDLPTFQRSVSCPLPLCVPKSQRPPPLRAPKPRRIIDFQKSIKAKDFNFIWNDRLTKNKGGMVNQKSDEDFCPEREQRVEGPLLLSDQGCLSRVRSGGGAEGPLPTSSQGLLCGKEQITRRSSASEKTTTGRSIGGGWRIAQARGGRRRRVCRKYCGDDS